MLFRRQLYTPVETGWSPSFNLLRPGVHQTASFNQCHDGLVVDRVDALMTVHAMSLFMDMLCSHAFSCHILVHRLSWKYGNAMCEVSCQVFVHGHGMCIYEFSCHVLRMNNELAQYS